jgi:hypothetical protein
MSEDFLTSFASCSLGQFGSSCTFDRGTAGWVKQVGDCRYNGNSGDGHGNYATITESEASSPEACVAYCAADPRCDAVDMYDPFHTKTCWLFEDSAGVHGGDGTTTSACWLAASDAGVCAGLDPNGADGFEGEVCTLVTGDWAGHVTTTYDSNLVCFVSALTNGDTCNSYCTALGRTCIKAMDNINSDNGAAKTDGTCEVGGGTPSCDGGQSAEECAQGCAQGWVGQICGCGPAACNGPSSRFGPPETVLGTQEEFTIVNPYGKLGGLLRRPT